MEDAAGDAVLPWLAVAVADVVVELVVVEGAEEEAGGAARSTAIIVFLSKL